MHITLRKSISTCTPIYFNIELHNGIPTIAYYVRNVKDPSTHKTFDTLKTHTYISSTRSLSSNNTASTYDISTSNANKKVASHLSKNICISSRTNLPQTDTTHSPVIKLIAQLHKQKKKITSFETDITKLVRSRLNDAVLKYHNDRKLESLQRNNEIEKQFIFLTKSTQTKSKSRQYINNAILSFFKNRMIMQKKSTY